MKRYFSVQDYPPFSLSYESANEEGKLPHRNRYFGFLCPLGAILHFLEKLGRIVAAMEFKLALFFLKRCSLTHCGKYY